MSVKSFIPNFSNWHFDVKSAVLSVVGLPLALYFLAILRKNLKSLGTYALEGVMYWVSRSFKHSLAGALTLKQYCRLRLAEENRYLLVPSSLDIKLPIDDVFVTLSLDQQGGTGATYNHHDLLGSGNRIRVIGDPGSGKSSLIKRIFRDACFSAVGKTSHARIPILIELKNLNVPRKSKANLAEWFVAYLKDFVNKSHVYQMGECFDTYVGNAGLLVLLDGLDEVSSSKYSKVQTAITALSTKLSDLSPNNIVILTMRTQFHQQVRDAYRESFGPAMFLKPFSPTDVYEFLARWPFGLNRDSHIARIYSELTDRPTLREMCSNPLVLAMYVAEDQAAGHVIAPESRTEFYQKVTEELIIKRRLKQTGPTPAYTMLREQRERILGQIAYQHMLDISQPANSLNFDLAFRVIAETTKCTKSEAKTAFQEIAKETGLVTEERTGQTFRFIHLTFCEFLAAYEAVQGQRGGWTKLIDFHRAMIARNQPELQTRLTESIPFACGLLPRLDREGAITDVESLKDDALLARCFLETKQYSHACWAGFVQRQQTILADTPEEKRDQRWLRDLHLFNVVIKDAVECSVHMPVAKVNFDGDEFLKSLLKNQNNSLSKLLTAYAAQDAVAAFRIAELSRVDLVDSFPAVVIKHCDQMPFFALVLERALRQPHRISKWAVLLSEAALQSRLVADSLDNHSAVDSLNTVVTSSPPRKRWYRPGIKSNTLYTQLLTIATNSHERENMPVPSVKIIETVPAPGSVWINPRILSLFLMLLCFLSIPLMFQELFRLDDSATALKSIAASHVGAKSSATLKGLTVTSLFGLYTICCYAMMGIIVIITARREAYKRLLFPGKQLFSDADTRFSKNKLFVFILNYLISPQRVSRFALNHALRRGIDNMELSREARRNESSSEASEQRQLSV